MYGSRVLKSTFISSETTKMVITSLISSTDRVNNKNRQAYAVLKILSP